MPPPKTPAERASTNLPAVEDGRPAQGPRGPILPGPQRPRLGRFFAFGAAGGLWGPQASHQYLPAPRV